MTEKTVRKLVSNPEEVFNESDQETQEQLLQARDKMIKDSMEAFESRVNYLRNNLKAYLNDLHGLPVSIDDKNNYDKLPSNFESSIGSNKFMKVTLECSLSYGLPVKFNPV